MAKKFATRKYNGDDRYSWAIFYACDVKGKRSPIFMCDTARPICTGMDIHQARATADKMERGAQSEQDKPS